MEFDNGTPGQVIMKSGMSIMEDWELRFISSVLKAHPKVQAGSDTLADGAATEFSMYPWELQNVCPFPHQAL